MQFEIFAEAVLNVLYTCALTAIIGSIVLGVAWAVKAKMSG